MEAVKPQGSGMRGPVGAEPTGSGLDRGGFFFALRCFLPSATKKLVFARRLFYVKDLVNNFMHPTACNEI